MSNCFTCEYNILPCIECEGSGEYQQFLRWMRIGAYDRLRFILRSTVAQARFYKRLVKAGDATVHDYDYYLKILEHIRDLVYIWKGREEQT